MDHGDTQVDEATFRRIHLPAYIDAINAGVGTIMPSYSSWNGVKCSANKHLMTDIIKNEYGFEGFLISDYNAIDEIPGDFKEQIRVSVLAGMDMFMEPEKYALFFNDLKQLVTDGAVPMSRIDDAVLRILRVKVAMGLLDPKRNQLADPRDAEDIRVARASRRCAPGRPRIARHSEERQTCAAAIEDRQAHPPGREECR